MNSILNRLLVPAGLALMLSSASAAAQIVDDRNFDANRLRVTANYEDVLNVYSGRVPLHLQWDVGLWLNYANDPVTLNAVNADGSYLRFASLLKDRADAHFLGTLALFDWVQIGLDVPVTFYQARRDPVLEGSSIGTDISAGGLGDIGVTLKLRLLKAEDHFVDLAFVPNVTISTATPRGAYLGEKKLSATPEFALSKTFLGFTPAANVAVKFREIIRETVGSLSIEHELIARLALRYDFAHAFDVPLTIDGSWEGFTQLKDFLGERNNGGSELLFGAGYEVADVSGTRVKVFGGGGFGVNPGYTIPDYRVFLGVSAHKRSGDKDNDGLMDSDDECPEAPEDMDTFEDSDGCPDLDNDQDGVLDVDDGAPLDPEDKDDFEDSDGIPDPDNDGDGVLDEDDACINLPGPREFKGCPDQDGDGVADPNDQCIDQAEDVDGYLDTDGCPDPDNDEDGIFDAVDECPMKPGPLENRGCPDTDRDADSVVDRLDNCPDVPGTVENNGCKQKQLVTIKGCKIDLSQKVYFNTAKASIQSRSFSLLDNVTEVLKAQDNIKKLRIEGHTDSRGSAKYNKNLSQQRADEVRSYLETKGIASERLRSLGLGEERPIDSNNSARGRENNRRVEMFIDDCKEVTAEVDVD